MSETLRKNITKEVFQKVLEDLLLEKELADITTTEIIERSGLSRATFYRSFADKYELANWSFKMLMEQLDREILSADRAEKIHLEVLRYIDEHRTIFKKLMHYDMQNSFRNYYMEIAYNWAKRSDKNKDYKQYLKEHYRIMYHMNGFLGVLDEWLKSDCYLTYEEIDSIIVESNNEERFIHERLVIY